MGHCDTYDANALRCRPQQKAWVWRRAFFLAMFRYFTLNTWTATSLYTKKEKGEQKEFLVKFRDALIEQRQKKLQQEKEQRMQQQQQHKQQWEKERYQQQVVRRAENLLHVMKVSREQIWTPEKPTVQMSSCLGRFHVSEAHLEYI